ncbi:MAG: UvrD-helicase domain-containing protein, partial [Phascolarctobacterium sp.]
DNDSESFWHKQLESLNRAQISTIHGLCSRILRENPVEVRLDPAFVVAEEFTSAEFLEDCLDKYLRRELREGNAATKKLMEVYGANGLVRLVESILPALEDIFAETDLSKPYLENVNGLPQLKDDLCILVRDMVLRRKDLVGKTSKAGKTLEQMAEVIEEICAGIKQEPADFSLLQQYLDLMQARGGVKDHINAIREKQALIENVAVDKAALELLPCWQEFLGGLNSYVREQKQQLDLLNYDDLENYTVELLQRNAEVRHKYQERYRYIMVDEFQDTNDRQRQLIYLLCGDDAEKLEGQKLFVVGDPKQSIYRFRGADVSVFARVRREIGASGGKNLLLKTNYRTVDKILLAVNSAFRLLMGMDANKDVFYEELANFKQGTELPQLLLVDYDKECGKSKFQVEAEAVAMAIEAYHEGRDYEGKQLLAPKVPYGKMAILLRAMTHSEDLAAALQARGIPYEIVDGKGFYACQEVLDMLNLLAALSNRYHSLELAGVLRSPYFGLDDETLTKLFLQKADCLWDAVQRAEYETFPAQQGALLARAAQILQQLREQASLVALPELWQCVWQKLAVDAVLSVQEHGANKLANVQKLRQLALEYSTQNQGTLTDWLDYVQRLRAAEARETTANLDAADAVQIMTIHKSKGLEFGTVFLPYLNSNTQSDTAEIKYLRGVGLGIKAPDKRGVLQNTNVLQKVKDEDKRLDLEERKRQLYVAMTRAEDRLIMTGIAGGKDDKSLEELSWLKQLMQIYDKDSVVEIKPILAKDKDASDLEQLTSATVSKEDLENIAPLPTYADKGPRAFSPSSLQTYLHCQRQY